ncbi:MAG: hypothetical protein Q8Q31_00455 [Nanoarchaeota archaeon]|nr:hypothetical protein [Nanoarchaeota archaeon]
MNKKILDKMLLAPEPEVGHSSEKGFNPIFNVREEFPLWVQEQFKHLTKHAKRKMAYEELEKRRDEVYQAALGVVKHGLMSTDACATARLREGWEDFERGFGEQSNPAGRAGSLEKFVEAIKDLSVSLGGNSHYTEAGIFLGGNNYKTGNLKAFVYRIGDKNGENSEYFILEEPQTFEGDIQPALIGELTHLTNKDVTILRRLADYFKGPEIDFIERADRIVPEEGSRPWASSFYGVAERLKGYGRGLSSWLGGEDEL